MTDGDNLLLSPLYAISPLDSAGEWHGLTTGGWGNTTSSSRAPRAAAQWGVTRHALPPGHRRCIPRHSAACRPCSRRMAPRTCVLTPRAPRRCTTCRRFHSINRRHGSRTSSPYVYLLCHLADVVGEHTGRCGVCIQPHVRRDDGRPTCNVLLRIRVTLTSLWWRNSLMGRLVATIPGQNSRHSPAELRW